MSKLTAQEVFDYLENLKSKDQDLTKYLFVADVCINEQVKDFTGLYMDYDSTQGAIYMVCNKLEEEA